jgi:hypothetical protein
VRAFQHQSSEGWASAQTKNIVLNIILFAAIIFIANFLPGETLDSLF